MPDASGAQILGQTSKPDPEPEKTPEIEGKNALYAFAIIADTEGNVGVYPYEAEGVDPVLKVNDDIVVGACAAVQKDIAATTSAQATVQMQMMQAQAMQQQMRDQALAQQVAASGAGRL